MQKIDWKSFVFSKELRKVLETAPVVHFAEGVEELFEASCGGADSDYMEVSYTLPDGRTIVEATVARVRNGIAANYPEASMRRRDPDCMVIADNMPTEKTTFEERFGENFDRLKAETFDWLSNQDLVIFAFHTGQQDMGDNALAVAPRNAAFFALGLALMQGIIPLAELPEDFTPKTIIYVAPPFRHTHFDGKQVVVHNRTDETHEVFSYNLYPGPSAKKGVYGSLIRQGAAEGWVTAHCSAVQVVTPYDNVVSIMHEGASGSGKSEMLEQPHRMSDGRLLMGSNLETGEKSYMEIPRMCELHPVCDDMALCHPDIQQDNGKLWLADAENGWFIRVNHVDYYGADPDLEKLTAQPPTPLLFLNIDAVPGSRALIWEHIEDEPGKPCPNPRVIVPRNHVPGVVDKPISVDVRSIGIRTPPCTRENPSYGIIGMLHILPPALAWIWRLTAPRGYSNPSIVDTGGMGSEGVGSYWPFATGRKVVQANLLLRQIEQTPKTRYVLIPNQHIGAWETGFMPQWLARDYLARRGSASFHDHQIVPARCPLLGYALDSMRIEGVKMAHGFLEVNKQPEVGDEGYDAGAKILTDFFADCLREFIDDDLDPLGRKIIDCCLANGSVEEFEELMGGVS